MFHLKRFFKVNAIASDSSLYCVHYYSSFKGFHGKHKSTHVGTKAQLIGLHLLTYSQLLPKDRPLAEGRAVPASVAKLILALVDAQLSALPDDDDGIRAALTDGTLSGGQTGDLVADDVRTQSHNGRQSPLEKTILTSAAAGIQEMHKHD